jgi:hypothetical protein
MDPLRNAGNGFRLVKSLAIGAIGISMLIADCLTGFRKMDSTARWICAAFATLGTAGTLYYWRQLNRGHSDYDEPRHRRHRHFYPWAQRIAADDFGQCHRKGPA